MSARLALALALVLASSAAVPTARADVWPMVFLVDPPRSHPVSIGVIGSTLTSTAFDGPALVGGGLAASFHVYGPYGTRGWRAIWFAIDVRVRLLDDLSTPSATLTLPVDLVARAVFVPSYSLRDVPCTPPPGPNAICLGHANEEPFPLQPYLGGGGTVAFPISAGDTRGGPIVVAGVQWFVDERVSLLFELELRALFGAPNVAGQAGLNVGLLFGP